MRTSSSLATLRLAGAAAVLLALSACSKPEPATPAAEPQASPPAAAPGDTPATTSPDVPPDSAPAAPAQPAPDSPPPTEPSAAPKPTTAAGEPSLESMQVARPVNSKIGVPVDLRYQFDGEVVPNQPVQLQLAVIPQVADGELKISVQNSPGVSFSEGTMTVQKAKAAGVYRKQVALTRQNVAAGSVRVLVTLDFGGGVSAFGFYDLPFDARPAARKQDSVKLE